MITPCGLKLVAELTVIM